MTKNDDILEKIKALRAKANNEASTEAEMEEAAKLVAKLMTKHDVDEADLDAMGEKVSYQSAHADMGRVNFDLNTVRTNVAHAIQELTGTKFWLSNRGQVIECVGVDHDVEMAVYLMEVITMTAKRAWRDYTVRLFEDEGMTRVKGRRESFYYSFAIRASAMLKELAEQRQRATGTALVVSKKAIIDDKLNELGVTLGRARRQKGIRMNADAARAGRDAASKMNLGASPRVRRLSGKAIA